MSALEGEAGYLRCIIAEGCVDRFCGRPYNQNPYSPTSAQDYWDAWNFGWVDADWLLKLRGQEEARRWLKGEAA